MKIVKTRIKIKNSLLHNAAIPLQAIFFRRILGQYIREIFACQCLLQSYSQLLSRRINPGTQQQRNG